MLNVQKPTGALMKMTQNEDSRFTNKFAALVLAVLMISSAFVVFSNSPTPTNAQITIPSNLLQYEWNMTTADLSMSYSSAGPAPDSLNLAWKTKVPGVTGAPVAFNGLVFVQTTTRTYALDGATGSIAWNISGTGALAKLDDTHMMKGTTCLNIADGSTVWEAPLGFVWVYYVPELKMFISPQYGWSLPDPSNPPTLSWDRSNERYYGIEKDCMPYVDGKLFVGTMDDFLLCIDAKTGELLWSTPSTSQFFYRGTYIDGKVIHGGLDNNMHAWDANTGELVWTYNPGTWYGQWASALASGYGMIYAHNQDTYLYAINATTGDVVWKEKGPGIGYSGFVVVGDGKVYSPMGEYQYRDFDTGEYAYPEYNCYDAFTGELIWTAPLETGAGPSNHECIAYGNLYIIPIPGTPSTPGVWEYQSISGMGTTLDEVWCISSEIKDWPMFLGNPEHTAEGAGPTNLALKWTFKADGPIRSSPAIVDDVAYFASMPGTIYAVDTNTGDKKWESSIDFPIKSSVAVVNGKLYTGTEDGNVHCLDAATGNELWQTDVGGVKTHFLMSPIPLFATLTAASDVRSSPVVFDNKIYVGALDGNFYSLDANTGTILWKYSTGGPILSTATIADNAIYVPACTPEPNGTLYKLDLNGNLVWQKDIPYILNATFGAGFWLFTAPTVADNMIYLRNAFRMNYGIDATTGETVWTYDGRYNTGTPNQQGGVMQLNTMLYSYGKLYFNDYYGLTCLDAKNGSVIWTNWLSRENLSPGLAYAYGRIYTVNELGALYVLDALTGDTLSVSTDFKYSQMRSAPALYKGNLYVGADNWNLYCFSEERLLNNAYTESTNSLTTSSSTPQPNQPSTIDATSTSTSTTVPADTFQNDPALTPASSPESTDTSLDLQTNILYVAVAAIVVAVIITTAVLMLKRSNK